MPLEKAIERRITEYVDSYDGRNKEPVVLPVRIPLLLAQGAEGIAVAMATKILPHNLPEIWKAQIAILKKKPFALFPDFQQGGLVDVDALATAFRPETRLVALIHASNVTGALQPIETVAVEPAGTLNTGNVRSEHTRENLERI